MQNKGKLTIMKYFRACVGSFLVILKIVTFVTRKVKLVSFSLFLDAFPPYTQDALWTMICRYKHIHHM